MTNLKKLQIASSLMTAVLVQVISSPAFSQQPTRPNEIPARIAALSRQIRPASGAGGTKNALGIALQAAPQLLGQSITLLPDGRFLLLGGADVSGPVAKAFLKNSSSSTAVPLAASLQHARAWHTATVLPDGTVLIFGGVDAKGLVNESELFDPATLTFRNLAANLSSRAYHTTTLLTDGRLLILGGIGQDARPLSRIDLWDPHTKASQTLPANLTFARRGHSATLQWDGNVLIQSGVLADGSSASQSELFQTDTQTVITLANVTVEDSATVGSVVTSIPSNGATNVPLDTILALRFSKVVQIATANATTIRLTSSTSGPINGKVMGAEGGRLAFISLDGALQPNTSYTIFVAGLTDLDNLSIQQVQIEFRTKVADGSGGSPAITNSSSASPEKNEDLLLPPLQAPSGVTALAGQVYTVSGKYLQDVTLELDCGQQQNGKNSQVRSDKTGRFLIARNVPAGHCELVVDGSTAHDGKNVYGLFMPGVDIKPGVTNVLSYVIWMTPLDTAHTVRIPSPTTSALTVTNPTIPGLELHLPPNATITDYDGKVVRELTITQIPLSRPPFPLPPGVSVPFFFTIQPGGAYISVNGKPGAAQLYYPNQRRAPAGFKMNFWDYDPEGKGWYIYGLGTVDPNRRYVIPDQGTQIYEFTGAMVASPLSGGGGGPCSCGGHGGDPVDLGTGIFTYQRTDIYIPDVIPLSLARAFRQWDPLSHAFGVGMSHNLDVFLVGDNWPYTYADLIQADGSKIHFTRTSPGFGPYDAVYQPTSDPAFLGSQIAWNGNGWNLTFKDGTVWSFGDGFQAAFPEKGALISIRDRYSNVITMTRDAATGRLLRVTSPSGRSISFTYDSANRVVQAVDNGGRSLSYSYDAGGRLSQVTDPNSGHFQYTYDANNQMLTLTDARGITFLMNQYNSLGQVIQQTLANNGTYQFAYTSDVNGNIIQTDLTDPRGNVRRVTFDTKGYFSGGRLTGQTLALGTSIQQVFSRQIQAQTNLVLSSTDPIGRVTSFTYDAKGNILTVTAASGTSNAATTTFTYDSTFNQVTSVTDTLGHTALFALDSKGSVASITDPLGNQATFTYSLAGQPLTMTNVAGTSSLTYDSGNLVAVSDPLGNTARRTFDPAGRVIRSTDPLGNTSTYTYRPYNELLQWINPLGTSITLTYDANGNALTVTDPRQNPTTYTYDVMDQAAARTDSSSHADSRSYDRNGNLTSFSNRKGQTATYTYDALNRLSQTVFADNSTITYTHDAADRITQVADSIAGTTNRSYDVFDRVTNETTPQGSISYTYDAAGRRTSMTVAGQTTANYTYDNANRLTQISQGSAVVIIAYDTANRRTSLTLPNGIVEAYSYDAASRLTSIGYSKSGTSLGNLLYNYDAAGRRTGVGGSLARIILPQALSSATYNANNQLTQWGSTTLTYDLNGNLTSDGINSYTWSARGLLTSIGSLSFSYDPFGRRTQNAVSKSFLYDGANAVQELSGGSVSANLLTGLGVDEIFSRVDSTGARYFLGDALGSTLALADSTGTVQTQYTYEPFGNTTTTGTTSSNTFEYTGRENDGTGLYYNRARFYSPLWGRFISEDRIGLASGDSNFYAYVLDNPIMFSDPTGLQRQLPTWRLPLRPEPGRYVRPSPQACPRPTPPGPLPGQPEPADLGRTWTADVWEPLSEWLDGMASGGVGLTIPFAIFPPVPGPLSPRKPCWI